MALTAGIALVLWAVASARAATVAVHDSCYKTECSYDAAFRAAPGERNDVTATHDGSTAVIVTDVGAPVTPGDGCVALEAHSARCSAPGDLALRMWLLDRDDGAAIDDGTVSGGAGDDRLSGGVVRLIGGPGSDDLKATGGGEFVDADGAHPARDRYTGSQEIDDLSYYGRRRGVVVDLGAQRAAEDEISGIDRATGTRHDDVLIGSPGANVLSGAGGHDRIVGRGGSDVLSAVHGTIDAGPGNDTIELGGRRATVRCGAGRDLVENIDGGPLLGGCETLSFVPAWEDAARLHERPRGAFLTHLGCNCRRARYVARAGRVTVADARGHPRALRLNARGRRMLARRGRLAVEVSLREQTDLAVEVSTFRAVLRRPRP